MHALVVVLQLEPKKAGQQYSSVCKLFCYCTDVVLLGCLCVSLVCREQEDREERDRLRKEGKPLPPELLREGMQHYAGHPALPWCTEQSPRHTSAQAVGVGVLCSHASVASLLMHCSSAAQSCDVHAWHVLYMPSTWRRSGHVCMCGVACRGC